MSASVDFQSQIASIMEVLANAAVAEICKVVDDGYAVVQLEMSQSHKDNEFLRRKIKLLELQIARFRAERMKFSEGSVNNRFGVRLLNRHSRETQASGPTFQNRARLANRNKAVQDRGPINVDHNDSSNHVVVTAKNESAEEEDLDLLIVKVEGAGGVDDTGTSRDPGRPPEDDRALTQPTTAKEKDVPKPTQPVSNATGGKVTEGQSTEEGESEQKPVEAQSAEETKHISQQDRGQDTSVQGYSEVKSDIIIIDPFPVEVEENLDGVGPSSSWRAGDMGTERWRGNDAALGGDSSAVHLGNQNSTYHHVPPLVQVTGRQSSASERLYPVNGAFDARFNAFQNNLGAPVSMTAGGQQQPLPAWVGFQENGTTPLSHLGNVSGPVTNQDQAGAESRPHRCAFCLRQFTHLCQLRIHERVHTGEKPYQCVQCGKQFGQFCSLKRHQRVHTGEKPYRCAQCGKQFSHSNNLKVHQSVHTGERRFHCTQCGKNFSFLSNLIRHQAVHAAGK